MSLPEKLAYDDVCLVPQYNNIESRTEPTLKTLFARKMNEKVGIEMTLPIIPSNMDTVIGDELADIIIKNGGIPFFHRFCSVEQQFEWAKKYKNKCAISAGVSEKEIQKLKDILRTGHRIFCIDIAHAHAKYVMDILDDLYEQDNNVVVVVGNIATTDAYHDLANHHAAVIKAGIGGGSACSTSIMTGHGYPMFSMVNEIGQKAKKLGVPFIADGGIRTPGDAAKAIAAGASSVMMGNIFAKTYESAAPKFIKRDGKYISIERSDIPKYLQEGEKIYACYRGQASKEFQNDFYGGLKKGTVAEGVAFYTEVSKSAQQVINEYMGGLRSALTYSGSRSFSEFRRKAEFVKVTPNYTAQSHPRVNQ